jgi:hypothetical protein
MRIRIHDTGLNHGLFNPCWKLLRYGFVCVVTVQWQKGDLNSKPSIFSDLDEKVLLLYHQETPIQLESERIIMLHPCDSVILHGFSEVFVEEGDGFGDGLVYIPLYGGDGEIAAHCPPVVHLRELQDCHTFTQHLLGQSTLEINQ